MPGDGRTNSSQAPPCTRGFERGSTYLQNKDLRLSHKALAVISFEQRYNVLDADLIIVGVDMIVLSVAQEDQQKAVDVRMVGLGSC